MPSKTPIYPLRLPSAVRATAEARSKALGMTLSAYITEAVEAINKAEAVYEKRQSLNSLCACGSGRKFKRCCAR